MEPRYSLLMAFKNTSFNYERLGPVLAIVDAARANQIVEFGLNTLLWEVR